MDGVKKICYTAIFGEYDDLKEPKVITEGWEYVCFTNSPNLKSSIWNIVQYNPQEKPQNKREHSLIARFLKINPHSQFGKENVLSVWVDGSIEINCNLDEFVNKYKGRALTIMKHPTRNCVYQEANACIGLKKDDEGIIISQMANYKHLYMPEHVGMVASGVIIRNHNEDVNSFCEKWWAQVNRFSIRDQLSFNFVAWISDFKYTVMPFDILRNEMRIKKHLK